MEFEMNVAYTDANGKLRHFCKVVLGSCSEAEARIKCRQLKPLFEADGLTVTALTRVSKIGTEIKMD